MGINTQTVTVDLSKQPTRPQVVRLGQGDKRGTTLVADVYDNGTAYNLNGKTARFSMRAPDGASSYSVAASSYSSNKATFNIDETYAASIAGKTDTAYVEILSGSTVICSTSRITVIVYRSASQGLPVSGAYSDTLIEAISSAQSAASSANSAASNANTKATRAENAATAANNATQSANTAKDAANAAASTATTAAGNANTAAEAANSAKDAANAAATAANTAARSANMATSEANAAIEAMGDISELAVPEMTSAIRGGAKVGGSTQVIGGKLEVKLSESATGTSVTTGSTSALRELQVHGQSVQDGTPTPDAPVPVQVVEGANLLPVTTRTSTLNGVTARVNVDGSISLSGTSTAEGDVYIYGGWQASSVDFDYIAGSSYTLSITPIMSGVVAKVYTFTSEGTLIGGSTTNPATGFITIRATENAKRIGFSIRVASGVNVDGVTVRVQFKRGSTATPYVPYGSIGLVVGDTATPIDLQGNTLASLPDGTRDELHVDSTGRVWIEKRVGKYVVTGNETITGTTQYTTYRRVLIQPSIESGKSAAQSSGICTHAPYVANTSQDSLHVCLNSITLALFAVGDSVEAVLSQYVGAVLYYALATPVTIDLGYITPPVIPSGSVVTVSASLTPTFDLDCWTEHASELADITDAITTLAGMVIGDEQEPIASSIAPVEGSTASANHAVGDYLMLGARLYRVTTAIASGERIIPGTNVTETTVMAEIVSLLS